MVESSSDCEITAFYERERLAGHSVCKETGQLLPGARSILSVVGAFLLRSVGDGNKRDRGLGDLAPSATAYHVVVQLSGFGIDHKVSILVATHHIRVLGQLSFEPLNKEGRVKS